MFRYAYRIRSSKPIIYFFLLLSNQGPCTNNQQSIIDGKFLEIANSLLSNMGKKAKSKTKDMKKYEKKKSITKTPLSEEVQVWMIERLKLKVSSKQN